MAFRRISYMFTADGSQFSAETSRMGRDAESGFMRAQRAAAGILGALTGAAAAMEQLVENAHQLDLGAVERLIASGLVGGDTATGEAWRITQGLVGGVGPEQAFDSAEAFRDAVKVKPRSVTDPILRDLGIDRRELLAETEPREIAYMMLDALAARGGMVDDVVLDAASELGAGDIRDMASMASVIARMPEFHPRAIADYMRPAMPTADEDEASALAALEWERTQAIADAEMSTRPWWSMHHAIRRVPMVGRWHTQQIANEAIAEGRAEIGDVRIVIEDRTDSGVRVTQKVQETTESGGSSTSESQRPLPG